MQNPGCFCPNFLGRGLVWNLHLYPPRSFQTPWPQLKLHPLSLTRHTGPLPDLASTLPPFGPLVLFPHAPSSGLSTLTPFSSCGFPPRTGSTLLSLAFQTQPPFRQTPPQTSDIPCALKHTSSCSLLPFRIPVQMYAPSERGRPLESVRFGSNPSCNTS